MYCGTADPYYDLPFGIFTMTLASLFFLLQIWYCKCLFKQRNFGYGAEFSSVILIVLSVADCCQLISHFASGIQLINQEERIFQIGYFGGLLTCGWNVVVFALCFFVFHRFLYLAVPLHARFLLNRSVLQVFLFLIILYVTVHMTFVVTWWELCYDRSVYDWRTNKDTTYILNTLNTITHYLLVFVPLPLNTVIFFLIWLRRKKFHKTVSTVDLWVIFQMLIFWLFAVLSCVMWEFTVVTEAHRVVRYLRNTVLLIFWNGLKPICFLIACLISPSLKRRRPPTARTTFIVETIKMNKTTKTKSLPQAN